MAGILDEARAREPADLVNFGALGNVYAVAMGKGGVGKTSTAANVGGLVASGGHRVLIVDLNGQGNIARNLGFGADEQLNDKGMNLSKAVIYGDPLTPLKDVRPNLDVAPGGLHIRDITSALMQRASGGEATLLVFLSLARAIAPIAADYDFIMIDSPPENPFLMKLAIAASRFTLAPMNGDLASQDGLVELGDAFKEVRRHYNPYVVLLGVFLFSSAKGSTNIRAAFRKDVEASLGGAAPVLQSFIRTAESVAIDLRRFGVLAHELEKEVKNNPSRYAVQKGKTTVPYVSTAAIGVADDFQKLTVEILTLSAQKRQQMQDEEKWPWP